MGLGDVIEGRTMTMKRRTRMMIRRKAEKEVEDETEEAEGSS